LSFVLTSREGQLSAGDPFCTAYPVSSTSYPVLDSFCFGKSWFLHLLPPPIFPSPCTGGFLTSFFLHFSDILEEPTTRGLFHGPLSARAGEVLAFGVPDATLVLILPRPSFISRDFCGVAVYFTTEISFPLCPPIPISGNPPCRLVAFSVFPGISERRFLRSAGSSLYCWHPDYGQ